MLSCVLGIFIDSEGEHLPFQSRAKLDKVHPEVFHLERENIKKNPTE